MSQIFCTFCTNTSTPKSFLKLENDYGKAQAHAGLFGRVFVSCQRVFAYGNIRRLEPRNPHVGRDVVETFPMGLLPFVSRIQRTTFFIKLECVDFREPLLVSTWTRVQFLFWTTSLVRVRAQKPIQRPGGRKHRCSNCLLLFICSELVLAFDQVEKAQVRAMIIANPDDIS